VPGDGHAGFGERPGETGRARSRHRAPGRLNPRTRSSSASTRKARSRPWTGPSRRFGGNKNPGAKKKAITAIAHTLLKIAYRVLKSGTPYQEPGADFCTRREAPAQRRAFLERQLQKLYPGCTLTITISPPQAALPTRRLT